MLKRSDILNILSVGSKLFLITAVSACVLAVVNNITSPIIAENTAKKQELAMQKVLPSAVKFEKTDMSAINLVEFTCPVNSVHKGIDENANSVGYAVMVGTKGYGGEISLAVGVDNDLKVTGIDVISHSETPSLGAKCTTDEFKNQFIGKEVGINVVKNNAKESEIDAISSATITSKAVTEGVNVALTAVGHIEGVRKNEK